MRVKHFVESTLFITAMSAGCSSDPGPPVEVAKVAWTDNGVQHSVMAPQAAVVTSPQDPPIRTFFITTVVDGQTKLNLSIYMSHDFATGDYHCGSRSDPAEITYGLAGENKPPALLDCVVTVYRIGVNHGGVVAYTEGAFAGSILVGDELHDLVNGTFSAPTIGLH
jgi:hypothetical protein